MAVFYNDYSTSPLNYGQPLTGGLQVSVTGDYPDFRNANMNDKASAVILNPKYAVLACKDINYGGQCITLKDTKVYTQPMLKAVGMEDAISSAKVISVDDQWEQKCCAGIVSHNTNADLCGEKWIGNYANCGAAACKKIINGQPNIMVECRDWCSTHSAECDAIKLDFCANHPSSSLCGCIYDKTQTLPGVAAPKSCYPESDCQKADLVSTLVPTNLRPVNCPNVSYKDYSNSVVVESGGSGNPNFLIYIILFVVILLSVLGIFILVLWDD